MSKIKVWLPMIALVIMVVWSVGSLTLAYTQRQQRIEAEDARQLVTQQAIEQETARQTAEKEKQEAEKAEQIASMPPPLSWAMPTPTPTPKPSPKPKENGTVTGPNGDVVVNQPEYAKPTPPPAPTPAPTPELGQPTPTPTPTPKPSQPKDGTERINADGVLEIYVGGFGWITSGGPNVTTPAHNAGTGEVIGF